MDTDTTFKYADLDERAQERAREWYSESVGQDWEPELDGICEALAQLGFEVDRPQINKGQYAKENGRFIRDAKGEFVRAKPRYAPAIHYSISWSQGDGASFDADWNAEDMNVAGLLEHAPLDEDLRRYAARLMVLFLRHPRAGGRIESDSGESMDVHVESHWTGVPDENEDNIQLSDADASELESVAQALAGWIYTQLRDDLEYQTSDEAVVEGIEANDYDFDEDGRPA